MDQPAARSNRGWLVLGLLLAAGATAAVFFTEDPLYLRVALLAVCWAFVVAAFVAGNRRADQVAAAGREAELRHAYDLELEREVAARHEYESELERRLRRETADAMRTELTQLRSELSGLAELRTGLAAVTQLRADLAGLGQLRTELANLTELRGELTGLDQLRAELAGLGELRSDLGQLRSELTEQLSGELLIERMVMRAQSVRGPAQPARDQADDRTVEGAPSWDVDRWSETRVVPAQPAEPAVRSIPAPPPVPTSPAARRHRRAAEPDDDLSAPWTPAAEPSPEPPSYETPSYETPEWASTSYEAPAWASTSYESPSYEAPTYEAPSWETASTWDTPAAEFPSWEPAPAEPPRPEPRQEPVSGYDGSAYDDMLFGAMPAVPLPAEPPAPTADPPSSGSRSSRRRYRDEDDGSGGDDVLARVLGR